MSQARWPVWQATCGGLGCVHRRIHLTTALGIGVGRRMADSAAHLSISRSGTHHASFIDTRRGAAESWGQGTTMHGRQQCRSTGLGRSQKKKSVCPWQSTVTRSKHGEGASSGTRQAEGQKAKAAPAQKSVTDKERPLTNKAIKHAASRTAGPHPDRGQR